MAVIGLLILAIAAALTVDVVIENTKKLPNDPMVVGQTVSGFHVGTLFLGGVVIGVLGMLGLSLLLAGIRRARRRRLEREELTRSYQGAAGTAGSLQEERDRLAAELEQERAGRQADHEQAATTGRRGDRGDAVDAGDGGNAGAGRSAGAGRADDSQGDRTLRDVREPQDDRAGRAEHRLRDEHDSDGRESAGGVREGAGHAGATREGAGPEGAVREDVTREDAGERPREHRGLFRRLRG